MSVAIPTYLRLFCEFIFMLFKYIAKTFFLANYDLQILNR